MSHFQLSYHEWTICFYQRENECYPHAQVNQEERSSAVMVALYVGKSRNPLGKGQHLKNNHGKTNQSAGIGLLLKQTGTESSMSVCIIPE